MNRCVKVAVDKHGNAAERAQPLEFVIAVERRDRVDLIGQALKVHRGEDLAHVRADEAADDADQRCSMPAECSGAAGLQDGLDTLQL